MTLPGSLTIADTVPVVIGSLSSAFQNIGRITAVNAVDLKPFTGPDIQTATDGSKLIYELDKGTLPLMLRARLDAVSKSVTVQLKVAKKEAVDDVTYSEFYDEAVEITFTTSADAIAAERGGFYADGFSIVGTDNTFKGIAAFNKYAKTTFVDVMGFLKQAIVCTALTGAWADIDITNS